MKRKVIMDKRWIFRVAIITLIISSLLAIISEITLRNLNIYFSITIFLVIIFLGIFFDAIGISFAIARPQPFNSMASRKIIGSKKAVDLINKSNVVSNFCNDVVGDISGIISGSAAAIIILKLEHIDTFWNNVSLLSVLLASFTAALTVGGKAFGKYIAVKKWIPIVHKSSIVIEKIEEIFKIKLF